MLFGVALRSVSVCVELNVCEILYKRKEQDPVWCITSMNG